MSCLWLFFLVLGTQGWEKVVDRSPLLVCVLFLWVSLQPHVFTRQWHLNPDGSFFSLADQLCRALPTSRHQHQPGDALPWRSGSWTPRDPPPRSETPAEQHPPSQVCVPAPWGSSSSFLSFSLSSLFPLFSRPLGS